MRKKFLAVSFAVLFAAMLVLPGVKASAAENSPQYYGVCTGARAFTDDCGIVQVGVTDSFTGIMYEVVDEYTPMRYKPYKDGRWYANLQPGDVIRNGKMISNEIGNDWLEYTDENGKKYYVYSGHLKEHIHTWETICKGDIGHTDICRGCNVCQLITDIDPYVHCGDNVLCQVFFGDWAAETSLIGIVINTKINTMFDPITSLRDASANYVHSGYEMRYGSFVDGVYDSFNAIIALSPIPVDTPSKMTTALEQLCQYLEDLGYTVLFEFTKDVLNRIYDEDVPYGGYCRN